MATTWDVAARLAEATPAVEHTQTYVWACRMLDYHVPDLTLHPAQVRDWFGTEDGLDLFALDADRHALAAVVSVAEEALRVQQAHSVRLSQSWRGAAADAAAEFLHRHCSAAESAIAAARTGVEALQGLRDNLWQIVEAKVSAVIAIDDRRLGERPLWLAAARTVTTGVGDQATASELVDQQVKPFVDNDIRLDWLSAMRAAIAAIHRSYAVAAEAINTALAGVSDTPAVPGWAWPADGDEQAAPVTVSAPASPWYPRPPAALSIEPTTAPGARAGSGAAPPGLVPSPTESAGEGIEPSVPGDSAAGLAPPSADLSPPPGVPTPAIPPLGANPLGELARVGQAVADTIVDWLPSDADGLQAPTSGGPEDQSEVRADREDIRSELAEETAREGVEALGADGLGAELGTASVPVAEALPGDAEAPVAEVVPDDTEAPVAEAVPDDTEAAAGAEDRTPCDIAAEELPQVGG